MRRFVLQGLRVRAGVWRDASGDETSVRMPVLIELAIAVIAPPSLSSAWERGFALYERKRCSLANSVRSSNSISARCRR